MIKSGGEWISSITLENAAMGHPKARRRALVHAELHTAAHACVLQRMRTPPSAQGQHTARLCCICC